MDQIKEWALQVYNVTYKDQDIQSGAQFVLFDTTQAAITNLTRLKTLCHRHLDIRDEELVNINKFIKILEQYTRTLSPTNNAELRTAHTIMRIMLDRIFELTK